MRISEEEIYDLRELIEIINGYYTLFKLNNSIKEIKIEGIKEIEYYSEKDGFIFTTFRENIEYAFSKLDGYKFTANEYNENNTKFNSENECHFIKEVIDSMHSKENLWDDSATYIDIYTLHFDCLKRVIKILKLFKTKHLLDSLAADLEYSIYPLAYSEYGEFNISYVCKDYIVIVIGDYSFELKTFFKWLYKFKEQVLNSYNFIELSKTSGKSLLLGRNLYIYDKSLNYCTAEIEGLIKQVLIKTIKEKETYFCNVNPKKIKITKRRKIDVFR